MGSTVGSGPNGWAGSGQGCSDFTGRLLAGHGVEGIVQLVGSHGGRVLGHELGSGGQLFVVVAAHHRRNGAGSPGQF